MTAHKKFRLAEKLYIETRRGINRKTRKSISILSINHTSITLLFTVVLVGYSFYVAYANITQKLFLTCLLPIWAASLYWSRCKSLENAHSEEFKKYEIKSYPIYQREEALHHSLFFENLDNSKLEESDIKIIVDYLTIIEKPKKPYSISQNIIFIFAIATLSGVSAEAIKITSLFQNGKIWVIFYLFFMAFFFLWMALDGIYMSTYQRTILKRALQLFSINSIKNGR